MVMIWVLRIWTPNAVFQQLTPTPPRTTWHWYLYLGKVTQVSCLWVIWWHYYGPDLSICHLVSASITADIPGIQIAHINLNSLISVKHTNLFYCKLCMLWILLAIDKACTVNSGSNIPRHFVSYCLVPSSQFFRSSLNTCSRIVSLSLSSFMELLDTSHHC